MRLVFVCFGFESENLRKQPWRYVDEITSGLNGAVDPVVVTDVDADVESIRVRSVPTLTSLTGPSQVLVKAVRDEDPDLVATVLGPSSFLRPKTIAGAIEVPTVGVMTSPLYGLREVGSVGITEFYRHFSYLAGHLVGALTPDSIVKRTLDRHDHIITLTQSTKDALASTGTGTPVSVVRPGLDPFDRQLPSETAVQETRSDLAPDSESVVLYFTSPLTLRGTDTLVEAFARIRGSTDATLVILSRQDGGGLSNEEQHLVDLAADLGIEESFILLPRNLSPEGVKTHLRASDIVALPYKIVISGVPISILEAMAAGRPVVTTRTDGLPELVGDQSQLVKPNDVRSLAQTLRERLDDVDEVGTQNREQIQDYPTWDDTRESFVSILEETR